MFDIEQAIKDWRQEMRDLADTETLDELESHLREDIEQQTRSGSDLKLSFDAAATRMGQRSALQNEFQKVTITKSIHWLKRTFRALTGVPDYQLATNMNTTCTNPNVEARWATYAKSATFLAPALTLWVFSCVFLMPKLKQIAANASLALPTLLQVMIFASSHFILLSFVLLLSLVFLEWRSNNWSKYRRATLGVSVFLINAFILLLITLMVFSALIAAPAMAHSAK